MNKDLQFEVIQDIESAEHIWKLLSPSESLYDCWEFRHAFYKYFQYPLYFLAGYYGDEPVGLLPLQYNRDLNKYEFFGGGYMEENKIFFKKGFFSYAQFFFDRLPFPSTLESMAINYNIAPEYHISYYKYVLDLSHYRNFEDYIEKAFSGKSRIKIRSQINKLLSDHRVKVVEDCFDDLELMFFLNKRSFGQESSFHRPFREQIFRDLLSCREVKILTVEVDGQKQAVSFGIMYRDTYVGVNSGTNKNIRDLGKYLIMKKVDQAISAGAKWYDARGGDFGWKSNFKLMPIPHYQYDCLSFQQKLLLPLVPLLMLTPIVSILSWIDVG